MKSSNLLKLAVVATALALPMSAWAVAFPNADAFGHTGSQPSCTSITGTSGNLAVGDDVCTTRSIGFSFMYYGTAYTTVGVASNGFLQLGGCGTGSTDFTNDPIPSTLTPNNIVAGNWDDLHSGTAGTIRDALTGSGTSQIYTVNYNGVGYFSGGGTATFQIQLHQNGGTGEMVRVLHTAVSQAGSSVGIENAAGTDGIQSFNNNTPSGAFCHQYSRAAQPPPGGCDLTPVLNALTVIEGKLDTNAARITALTNTVNGLRALLCEIIKLENTPHGQRVSCSPAVLSSCGVTYSWNSESTGGPQPNPPACP